MIRWQFWDSSRVLSGTIQSAQMAIEALKEEYPERTILCLDTLCAAVGKPRGKKKALLSNMEKGWMPEISNQVIIGHGDSLDVAKELRDIVAERFPEAEIYIAPIGPVIGAHAGPGVMTVFFWGNNH